MFDFIKKLREKPEEVRRRYTFLVSGVIMVLIVVFWVSMIPMRFGGDTKKTVVVQNTPSPVASLGSTISNGVKQFKDAWSTAISLFGNNQTATVSDSMDNLTTSTSTEEVGEVIIMDSTSSEGVVR